MAIDKDKLLASIDARGQFAYGGDFDSQIAQSRAQLISAYLGENTDPAPEGRSQVVDRSVFETVQTILPSLVRIYAGSEEVVKFTPIGPEDEAAAEQTTAYINYLVQKGQWEQFCADWIHDALLLHNGYALPYWEDEAEVTRETYEGLTVEQITAIQEDGGEIIKATPKPDEQVDKENAKAYQQALQQFQQIAAQYQMEAQQAMMQGQQPPPPPQPPQPPRPAFIYDVQIERREEGGKLCYKVLAPEHCIVEEATPDWTLTNCAYFEYREEMTIAELREMGLDVDEDVSDSTVNTGVEDRSRNRFMEKANTLGQDEGERGIMRKVVTRVIWVKSESEDKKSDQMYYVIAVGRTILWAEPVSRIHAVSLVSQPLPHRHPGYPVAEQVMDIQAIKTSIKRGGLDNLYLANNGRNVVSSKVNIDDFLDSRPGGVVRLHDEAMPGEGHVQPLVHPFAFDSIIGQLEYFDQERQNRAGVSRYFSGTDAGAINKTASGINQLTNAAAQRVEHIARMMAPAFEQFFSICLELVSKHQAKSEIIKLRGNWVNVDPTSWHTRRDVKISVGVGAGAKDSMLQALEMQFGKQMAIAQSPLGIVKPENIHATLVEQAKLQGFANPDKFWTNPAQNPPQPQGPPPEFILEQKKLEQAAQESAQQAQLDKYKADLDAHTKLQIAELQSQTTRVVEAMKTQMDSQALQLQQMQNEFAALGNIDWAGFRDGAQHITQGAEAVRSNAEQQAALAQHIDGIHGTIAEGLGRLEQRLTKPRKVIRDASGKIAGVE